MDTGNWNPKHCKSCSRSMGWRDAELCQNCEIASLRTALAEARRELEQVKAERDAIRLAWPAVSEVFDWISEHYPNALVAVPSPLFREFQRATEVLRKAPTDG